LGFFRFSGSSIIRAGTPIAIFQAGTSRVTTAPPAMKAPSPMLMPGISVGEGAFIAGGAVVTRDVPAWKMAVGVPARIVDLPENLKKPNRLGE